MTTADHIFFLKDKYLSTPRENIYLVRSISINLEPQVEDNIFILNNNSYLLYISNTFYSGGGGLFIRLMP